MILSVPAGFQRVREVSVGVVICRVTGETSASGLSCRDGGHPGFRGTRILSARNSRSKELEFDARDNMPCDGLYAGQGVIRPSDTPRHYFRTLMADSFESLSSKCGIAWRCAKSFSLETSLGCGPADATPTDGAFKRILGRLSMGDFASINRLNLGILQTAELV